MESAHEPEESDENLLTLRSSTLTALTSFLAEQAADFETIISLTTQFCPPDLVDLQQHHDIEVHTEIQTPKLSEGQTISYLPDDIDGTQGLGTSSGPESPALPVDKFKKVFKLVLTP